MTETAAVPCIPRVAPGSGAETRAVRTGIATDGQHGAVIPPIYLSSTYAFAGFKDKRTYDYTRTANPTRDVLGLALAELEEGAGAVVTSTGLSAVLLMVQLLRPEDRLVAPHDCYGGTRRLLDSLAERGTSGRIHRQSSADALTEALSRPTRMLWVETPSNPLLRITDLRLAKTLAARQARGRQHLRHAHAAAAARAGRRRGGALHHQVPQRPQRRGGRCRRGPGTGPRRAARVVGQCDRGDRCAIRQLSHPARPADFASPDSQPPGECHRGRRAAGRASGGSPGALSRPARSSGTRKLAAPVSRRASGRC